MVLGPAESAGCALTVSALHPRKLASAASKTRNNARETGLDRIGSNGNDSSVCYWPVNGRRRVSTGRERIRRPSSAVPLGWLILPVGIQNAGPTPTG